MRSILKGAAVAAVLGASAFFAAAQANAQLMDLSTIICEELFEASDDDAAVFIFWLDGWFAGQADDTTLDLDVLEDQIMQLALVCAQNPALSVMNAAREVIDD